MAYQPEKLTFTSLSEALKFVRQHMLRSPVEAKVEAKLMLTNFGHYRLDQPGMARAIDIEITK